MGPMCADIGRFHKDCMSHKRRMLIGGDVWYLPALNSKILPTPLHTGGDLKWLPVVSTAWKSVFLPWLVIINPVFAGGLPSVAVAGEIVSMLSILSRQNAGSASTKYICNQRSRCERRRCLSIVSTRGFWLTCCIHQWCPYAYQTI